MKKIVFTALLSIMLAVPQSIHSMGPLEWFCLLAFPVGGIGGSICCVIGECFTPCCNPTERERGPSVALKKLPLDEPDLLQPPLSARCQSLSQTASPTQPESPTEKQGASNSVLLTTAAAAMVINQSLRPSLSQPTSQKASDILRDPSPRGYVQLAE